MKDFRVNFLKNLLFTYSNKIIIYGVLFGK